MTALSKYWTFVSLDPGGGYRKREVAQAKLFVEQQFSLQLSLKDHEADSANEGFIQKQLFSHYKVTDNSELSQLTLSAEWCLRCYISHQILQTCVQLASQFGQAAGFHYSDLLPYVLTDVLSPRPVPTSLAQEILESFEAQLSSLATWTTRKVKYHRALNDFLLEHGIYLISNWAILNDTKPKQLERILVEFHHLGAAEVQQWLALLQAYHQVYRADRLQQRSQRRNQPCLPPSEAQLQRICQVLAKPPQMAQSVLRQLQELAEWVRRYRIQARGGATQQASLDTPQYHPLLAKLIAPQPSEQDETEAAFLAQFRREFAASLDQAIAQVVEGRLTQLQAKKPENAARFRTALKLFHCQGQSMGAIAPQIGLEKQYQVTRLLALKEMRDAVRRQMILVLRRTCLSQLEFTLNPDQLHALDAALEELIDQVISESEAEVSQARGTPLRSRFAHSLCQYLC